MWIAIRSDRVDARRIVLRRRLTTLRMFLPAGVSSGAALAVVSIGLGFLTERRRPSSESRRCRGTHEPRLGRRTDRLEALRADPRWNRSRGCVPSHRRGPGRPGPEGITICAVTRGEVAGYVRGPRRRWVFRGRGKGGDWSRAHAACWALPSTFPPPVLAVLPVLILD
jgi:hypothetical protein